MICVMQYNSLLVREQLGDNLDCLFLGKLKSVSMSDLSFWVWLACVLSNGCKSLTSLSSGNRIAREARGSVAIRNQKEVSGKHLPQWTET